MTSVRFEVLQVDDIYIVVDTKTERVVIGLRSRTRSIMQAEADRLNRATDPVWPRP